MFGSFWTRIAAAAAALAGLALVVWRVLASAKQAGRNEAELKQRRKHDAAIEQGRKAEADAGSGSDRDRRLSGEFDRD